MATKHVQVQGAIAMVQTIKNMFLSLRVLQDTLPIQPCACACRNCATLSSIRILFDLP
ncbi:hypothetical protein CLU79DRAFT_734992 [Phycomyces nitens]|nr:hypothetical protein CLU79DRAFT_734992 [Phycomyces nitens]